MKNWRKLWLLAVFALLLAVVLGVSASAETMNGTCGNEGDNLTWSLDTENGVLTVSGTGKMKNFSNVGKAPWAAYGDSIREVKIEAGVTSVGRWAFADCAALKTATLPEGLTAVSYGAFEKCVALTTISLPSTLKTIGFGAFQGCKSLVAVTLPEALTLLDGKAFSGCSSLKEVVLPAGVTELKWGVFENCTSLKKVPIHDGVKKIDAYAFKGCVALENVTLSKNVKSIGGNAFEKCIALVKLVVSSIKTWISGGATTIPDNTTIYAEPGSGAENYADTYNKDAVIDCTHQSVTTTVVKAPTCTATGKTVIDCDYCEYSETVITAPTHKDEEIPSTLGFTEAVCQACGHRAMILRAGETLKLSAFCSGTLRFTVEANLTDEIEVIVDGTSKGTVALSDTGVGSVTIENLANAGHTVEFVNDSENDIYVKNEAIDGYFHRYDTVYEDGAVYLEILGKGNLEYSDFYAYVRTADPSGQYYVRYKFDYIYNATTNNYLPNTCTNIGSYRLNGAELVRVTTVGSSSITAQVLKVVLGGGEVSLAIRQQNPYMDLVPDSAKGADYIYTDGANAGQCIEHVGGFHGDEWLSVASLIADGTVIDLKTSDKKVVACGSILFDLTTTMYAWGTSREDSRGLAFAEHIQNFSVNAKGINHMQTIEWLRGDYQPAGYMPMFTLMRGPLNDRFIDTMTSYDANGNEVGTYTMTPDAITSQTNVLADWAGNTVAAYEYSGSQGISARIDFREANENVNLASYIAMRVDSNGNSADNKMYAPFSRAQGGMPELGEIWMVESHYMIDYVEP